MSNASDFENSKPFNRSAYKPDLLLENPDEFTKVALLEEAVMQGSLDDVKMVFKAYTPFEITARALGLACRYRGIEFVRVLIDLGATFMYDKEQTVYEWESFVGKYHTEYKTSGDALFKTEYDLMLLAPISNLSADTLDRSPFYGIPYLIAPNKAKDNVLPVRERIGTAKFLLENNTPGFSGDELLFYAILLCDFELAQALIDLGVDLNKEPPVYYSPIWWDSPKPGQTYLEMIEKGDKSLYWNSYMDRLSALSEDDLCRVMEMLGGLTSSSGQKLIVTKKLFDSIKWGAKAFAQALKYADLSKVDQKKALEQAAESENIGVLSLMAGEGWLDQSARREKLIEFASKGGYSESLAWLLEFKNRTVDTAAEQAKKAEKTKKELAEKPDSVSGLKKIWGFKKQEDKTLVITNYKGNETEVVIPAMIGKDKVTLIEGAFSAAMSPKLISNADIRKKITSVSVPDGVTVIGAFAFDSCGSLSSLALPDSLEEIGRSAFGSCKSLSSVILPGGVKSIGWCAFIGCEKLTSITISNTVTIIDQTAFRGCKNLTIHAPAGSYAEQYAKENNIPFVAE